MPPLSRRRLLAAAGAAAVAGCSGVGGTTGEPTTAAENAEAVVQNATEETATQREPGGLDEESFAFPTTETLLSLPATPEEIQSSARSGGVPKDGIPSIDTPKFVGADEAGYLDDGDVVFGVARNGVVKAYPQRILAQHEIVNDRHGDQPVSVTYCPLTGTTQGFLRGDTQFGVSGMLINANLVMYDRETETWWPQMLATSIPGAWNEDPPIRTLREFRLVWTTWKRWRSLHPDTEVLSTETGFARSYSNDPYGSYNPRRGYYEEDRLIFSALNENDRYDNKRVVLGARTPEGAAAFLKDALASEKVMTGAIGDLPVVAVYDARYDTGYVYANPEETTFEYDSGGVVAGGAAYPPDALPLARIHTFDAMWFAWAGYYPETNVYD